MDNETFEITHRINEDGMTVAQLAIDRDKYKALCDRYEKALQQILGYDDNCAGMCEASEIAQIAKAALAVRRVTEGNLQSGAEVSNSEQSGEGKKK